MPVKVAHIITQLELGGAQLNTLYTVSHLDPKRFQPILIAGEGGILDPQARAWGGTLYYVKNLSRPIHPLRDFRAFMELHRILRKEKPHIIHTHSSKAGILGRWAAWLAGVPVRIHTYHGFGFHPLQNRFHCTLLMTAEWLTSWITTRVIFVSQANQETAGRLFFRIGGKSSLIRSGIPLQHYPARLESPEKKRLSLGIGPNRHLITSIGNLKPQKNPKDFILLAKMVYEKVPEARFFFIGDGESRGEAEDMVLRYGLHEKCFFPGWRQDVAEILTASDLFVLTSLWEGLPRSLVEAMATGLPVAAYSVDGIRDVVRNGINGYLAYPRDVGGLAEKVIQLLRDPPLRLRMGEAAKKSVGQEFDIDHMVQLQEKLYGTLT